MSAAAGYRAAVAAGTEVDQATSQVTWDPTTIGVVGAGAPGHPVRGLFLRRVRRGRMARFNGARQGIAVWLWALLLAIAGMRFRRKVDKVGLEN